MACWGKLVGGAGGGEFGGGEWGVGSGGWALNLRNKEDNNLITSSMKTVTHALHPKLSPFIKAISLIVDGETLASPSFPKPAELLT